MEALHWLAFRRLPLMVWSLDGDDFRLSTDNDLNATRQLELEVTDDSCDYAGLPANPRNTDDYHESVEFYDEILRHELSESDRATFLARRSETVFFENQVREWESARDSYLEYYKAKLFVDLREQKITAQGVIIPASTMNDALKYVAENNIDLTNLPIENISNSLWLARNIDWENNALRSSFGMHCWVHFNTSSVFDLYPVPTAPTAGSLVDLGSGFFALHDSDGPEQSRSARRGRPSLPWDRFHLEVASLVRAGNLPVRVQTHKGVGLTVGL
jgi:hypothetical protein